MLKSVFFWRSYLVYVVLLLFCTFIFAGLLINRLHEVEISRVEDDLKRHTDLLSLSLQWPLQTSDFDAVRTQVEEYSLVANSRFTVLDVDGVVLADSFSNPFDMSNHLRRPEVQEAIRRGSGSVIRFSETLEKELLYYSATISMNDQFLGVVRGARVYSELTGGAKESQNIIMSYAAIIFVIAMLIAFYFSSRESQIVESISTGAQIISKGGFEQRVSEKNLAGYTRLAQAINQFGRISADRMSEVTADRNRLTTIFAGMVEGVIDVDQNQNINHVNDAAAKLLNISTLASCGKPVWEEIRNHKIVDAFDQAIKTQSEIKTQTTLSLNIHGNINERMVEIYAASLNDDVGLQVGAVVVLHDVTELHNLERVRTDFVANASHELKTPITAIRGLSETILSDSNVGKPTIIQFMSRVHLQSIRLSQLVADLLTISRLEAGQTKEDFSLIDMNDLVAGSVQMFQATKEKKDVKLSMTLRNMKVQCYGDRQNLSQLIDNLIDNAVKYTGEDGKVSVELFAEEESAVFTVSDSGIGISPLAQQRIFERFYRVDKVRSQSLGGTGLGLSIVKNIAEKHGGSVSVRSHLGRGSIFTFRMPMAHS